MKRLRNLPTNSFIGEITKINLKSQGLVTYVSITFETAIIPDVNDELRDLVVELVSSYCGTGKDIEVIFEEPLFSEKEV
jgi:hypothetical protein